MSTERPPTVPATETSPATGRKRLVPLLVALVASWVVPLLTNLAHVDWLLPPLLLLATASLLRAGRTVLDRLMCAMALVFGATLAAGLLLSVWPWHLAPVGAAGLGGTVLTAVAAVTGRRPQLPRLLRRSDLITLGYAAVCAAVALLPLVRRDLAGRLSLFMHVEDFSRHLMIYDTIRTQGGYLFLHKAQSIGHVYEPGFLTYPQGGHFTYALLENFLESSAVPGNPLTWTSNFIWLHTFGFIAMCLAVLWAAQRVAGPSVGIWRAGALGALITAYLLLDVPITVFDSGYPQEVTSLAVVAMLAGVAIRPIARDREQILLVGALLVAISFTYYLFLPVAGVIALGWLVAYRRRVLPRWRYTLVVGVVSLALAAVPPLLNRSADPGTVLLQNGQAIPVRTHPLWGLGLACVAASILLIARRRRFGVVAAVAVIVVGAFSAGVNKYQAANAGASYFWYKTLHEAIIVILVASGVLAAVLRLPPRLSHRSWWRLVTPVAAAIVAIGSVGYFARGTATSMSEGRRYLTGRTAEPSPAARDTVAVFQRFPHADDKLTVVYMDGQWPQFYTTIYLGIMHHQYGTAEDFAQHIRPWNGKHNLPQIEPLIASSTRPVRVIAKDPQDLADLRAFAATLPSGKLEVVDFNAGG
ncbi:hypothetical protein [Rugosimonospora africana]|nr:hypothetical protein [Rugosimonospora africana]